MAQHSTASETDACVVTPIDDYELLDFGAGRKLERWGEYLVEYPDRLARGEPACRPWSADWIYVDDVGTRGHWEPTRMGVTIRHLSHLLNEVEARTKLLITLSDGKPDDYDTYRGAYGIEDPRQALIEARRDGIHSFCITIDTEAKDYLPHMYGAANYTVIDEVRKLPLKVLDIYRRLTT